jgi:arylsulfatase A-like enzyme/cytochrome c-type biogenesis protein CcmH/NrfG
MTALRWLDLRWLARRFPAVGLAAASIAMTACGREAAPGGVTQATPGTAVAAGTPVVLISIDTLRSDHLPMYGSTGSTAVATPHLDALRRDGLLFTHAYSHMPLTLPSHTTVLTGLLPAQSGVRDNVGYPLDRKAIDEGRQPHLAKLLQARGYATGAAVSAYVLQGKTGLSAGFDFYDDDVELRANVGLGGMQRPGSETLSKLEPWLRDNAAKPFFLFFHLYEPHTPYDAPAAFAAPGRSAYDAEIAAADAVVGRLLDELRRTGAYDRALVILFSDHGEGLGEHGEDEHGVLLYREALQVPLVVKLPAARRAGETIAAPTGLFDVAPTVLEVLGLDKPAAMTGRSLLGIGGEPARRIYSETFYPKLHFGWSDLHSLVDGAHHLIDGPDPELYDLAADSRETRNLRDGERRVFGELRRELASYDRTLAPPAALDEETRQAMASLGYLGGAVAADDGPAVDPKAKVGSLRDFRQATEKMASKDYRGAVEALQRTLRENPRMADAWEILGRAYERLGDRDAAIGAYESALKSSGGSSHVAAALASLFLAMNRLDDAETHAKMALGASAGLAHGILAQVAKERGDLDRAEKEALASMEEKGDRVGPLVTLADVLHARGRYEEALRRLGEARQAYEQRRAKDRDLLRGMSLIEGRVQADIGDAAKAEAAFRKEIELFPEDLRAYSSLAILFALIDRAPEAGATIRRMVEANPSPAAFAEAVKTYRVLRDDAGATKLLRYALSKYPQSAELRALTTASGLVTRRSSR